ncbi:MAG TPA: Asp-tRNA(Asn)/Glu-tRNA(Gln) amidotransferase subunit GatA [Fimbriimonadaceae bacterium]|nr:Asp-tRNA(Asn)/Glu-tRNA(Gln) amidotransferase subunit GatA [Fimbriimonadaceae bacterium]
MVTQLSAAEIGRQLRDRSLSAVEVAEAFLNRIEAVDPAYGAFLKVDREGALRAAHTAQGRLDRGEAGPLTGVPVALKDNLSTDGMETTCASKILKDFVPPFDATVVERCKSAGMVPLGKTNLDEFAMGTSTENSAFQLTRNPWDAERSPGGSSGGSAAAVAAELTPLALGSDTGGSIRQPAALCGVVGFKPTYGRVSRFGLVAFGSSLDQIGPFARTVEDAALLAEAISGEDRRDSTCLPIKPIRADGVKNGSLKGLKVGLPKELFDESTQEGVRREVMNAVEAMKREGVEFEEISLPSIRYGVTTYYIIAPAEASSNLARFDGIRYGPRSEGSGHIGMVERTRAEGFGHEVKTRIMIGTYALSAGYYDAYYLRAQQVRTLMQREFEEAFQRYDAILSPTSPVTAFKLGELKADPMALKLLDYCTIPANMGGLPALSLNCGFDQGLPVGLQVIAPPLQDEKLLQMAYCVEQILPDAVKRPPVP